MGTYRVATAPFQVFGDGVSNQYQVDLAKEFPGISGYEMLAVYYMEETVVSDGQGNTSSTAVAVNLNYIEANGVLTVTLPSVPPKWFAPYNGPSPSPFVFTVAIAY